jgi:hypothetical protein
MEKGNKLCDITAMEITRIGDAPKVAEPVEEKTGIARHLYEFPKELLDIIQAPLELSNGKVYEVNMTQHKGQAYAVISEVGLVNGLGKGEDVLSFGLCDSHLQPSVQTMLRGERKSTPDFEPTFLNAFGPVVVDIPEPLRNVKVPPMWHGGDALGRPDGPLPGDIVMDADTMQQYVVGMSPERADAAHNLICDVLLQMVTLDILRNRKRQNRTKKMRGSVIRHRSKQSFRQPR